MGLTPPKHNSSSFDRPAAIDHQAHNLALAAWCQRLVQVLGPSVGHQTHLVSIRAVVEDKQAYSEGSPNSADQQVGPAKDNVPGCQNSMSRRRTRLTRRLMGHVDRRAIALRITEARYERFTFLRHARFVR